MQISPISNIAPSPAGVDTTSPRPKSATISVSTAAAQNEPAATPTSPSASKPSTSASAIQQTTIHAPSKSTYLGNIGSTAAPVNSAANNSAAPILNAPYSSKVGGKTYSGSVEDLGGMYVATVPSIHGAVATGTSLGAAEDNLDIALDLLA